MAKAVTPLNAPNNTANFYPITGGNSDWRMELMPIAASSAMVEGTALGQEVSASSPTGNLIKMPTTNANGQNFVGIIAEPITATDSDYATAGKLKSVWVPVTKQARARFIVGSGTFTTADVGRVCQFHTDSKSLAVDTNGAGAMITGYISSTTGECSFNVANVTTA